MSRATAFLRRHRITILICCVLVIAIVAGLHWRKPLRYFARHGTLPRGRTVESVLATYGEKVRAEFEPVCAKNGIAWPPKRVQMLAFKREKMLELWAGDSSKLALFATFPILAASGDLGPKRREGDRQVPEGIYRLTELNPQSNYHLSIRVDYPNEDDIQRSTIPVSEMGGDIYIHGDTLSIGCLAMGDEAIEKIFCLTAWADPDQRSIIISPVDFRSVKYEAPAGNERLRELYEKIWAEAEMVGRPLYDPTNGTLRIGDVSGRMRM